MAAFRATTEDEITQDGRALKVVRGLLQDTGKPAALFPGRLPARIPPNFCARPVKGGRIGWMPTIKS